MSNFEEVAYAKVMAWESAVKEVQAKRESFAAASEMYDSALAELKAAEGREESAYQSLLGFRDDVLDDGWHPEAPSPEEPEASEQAAPSDEGAPAQEPAPAPDPVAAPVVAEEAEPVPEVAPMTQEPAATAEEAPEAEVAPVATEEAPVPSLAQDEPPVEDPQPSDLIDLGVPLSMTDDSLVAKF